MSVRFWTRVVGSLPLSLSLSTTYRFRIVEDTGRARLFFTRVHRFPDRSRQPLDPCNQLFTRPSLPLSKRSVKRRLASAVWRISNRIKPHDCRTREPLINVASLVKKSPLRQHRSSWNRELGQKLVKTVVSVVVLRFLNPS